MLNIFNVIIILHLLQRRGPYHRRNQTTQEHKKWLAIPYYRIGVCTQPTLIRAKHFSSAPTVTWFNHHNTGIQKWGRNEGILNVELYKFWYSFDKQSKMDCFANRLTGNWCQECSGVGTTFPHLFVVWKAVPTPFCISDLTWTCGIETITLKHGCDLTDVLVTRADSHCFSKV